MDLQAIAENAAKIGFDIAGNAKETATLHLGKTQTYNFDTDTATESGGSDVIVEGIFYREAQRQMPTNEGMFLVKGEDAPNGIHEADTLTRAGVKWQIFMVEAIPTKAVYILHIRR